MKNNKNSKIEFRIEEDLKIKFNKYAKNKNIKISDILRNYIKRCVENGEND